MLMSCWSLHPSHFGTKLKIYYIVSLFTYHYSEWLLESVLPRSYLSHARIMLINSPFTLFLFHSLTLVRLLVLYKWQKITKNKMRPALLLQWISSMLFGDHKESCETFYTCMYSMNSLVTKHYQENTSELHVSLVYA